MTSNSSRVHIISMRCVSRKMIHESSCSTQVTLRLDCCCYVSELAWPSMLCTLSPSYVCASLWDATPLQAPRVLSCPLLASDAFEMTTPFKTSNWRNSGTGIMFVDAALGSQSLLTRANDLCLSLLRKLLSRSINAGQWPRLHLSASRPSLHRT